MKKANKKLGALAKATPRSSHGRFSVKKAVLKNFSNFHRTTPVLESNLLKRDSNTGAFL